MEDEETKVEVPDKKGKKVKRPRERKPATKVASSGTLSDVNSGHVYYSRRMEFDNHNFGLLIGLGHLTLDQWKDNMAVGAAPTYLTRISNWRHTLYGILYGIAKKDGKIPQTAPEDMTELSFAAIVDIFGAAFIVLYGLLSLLNSGVTVAQHGIGPSIAVQNLARHRRRMQNLLDILVAMMPLPQGYIDWLIHLATPCKTGNEGCIFMLLDTIGLNAGTGANVTAETILDVDELAEIMDNVEALVLTSLPAATDFEAWRDIISIRFGDHPRSITAGEVTSDMTLFEEWRNRAVTIQEIANTNWGGAPSWADTKVPYVIGKDQSTSKYATTLLRPTVALSLRQWTDAGTANFRKIGAFVTGGDLVTSDAPYLLVDNMMAMKGVLRGTGPAGMLSIDILSLDGATTTAATRELAAELASSYNIMAANVAAEGNEESDIELPYDAQAVIEIPPEELVMNSIALEASWWGLDVAK
jgi:hypothetical protein